MERKAMMGHLVSKSSEGCSTIGDNTGAVKNTAAQRPCPWTCKGQGLDVEPHLRVENRPVRRSKMELPCCVVSLCVQCNQEKTGRVKERTENRIKNLSKICPKLKHIIFPLALLPPEIETSWLAWTPRKWMLFRRSAKMDLLETFGPQDDFGRRGISPLHPIKQSVLMNKGL